MSICNSGLSPEYCLEAWIPKCLLNIITWKFNRYLTLNIFQTEPLTLFSQPCLPRSAAYQ